MPTKAEWIAGGLAAITAVVLLIWGPKEHWSAEICLGVAGLWIALWGFVLAVLEIQRASSVSKETRKAVNKTLKGVRASRLGITITQLRQTMQDLEDAAARKDADGARRAVNGWQYLAAEARGPLSKRFPGNEDLIKSLTVSLDEAFRIKGPVLAEAEGQPLWTITEKALAAMAEVCNELAALLEELMPATEDGNGNS
jgi:hypothetical protein